MCGEGVEVSRGAYVTNTLLNILFGKTPPHIFVSIYLFDIHSILHVTIYLHFQILLKFGAVMPTLEEVRARFDNGRPGRARAVFHLCEAFTSEAYLLQTSDDLLRDVFEATEKLREVRSQEKSSLEERGVCIISASLYHVNKNESQEK